MSKYDKLVKHFLSKPADFTWGELKTMLSCLGYVQSKTGKTGGSRVKFNHQTAAPIILHRPHPRPALKRYQLEQIEEVLKKEGLL